MYFARDSTQHAVVNVQSLLVHQRSHKSGQHYHQNEGLRLELEANECTMYSNPSKKGTKPIRTYAFWAKACAENVAAATKNSCTNFSISDPRNSTFTHPQASSLINTYTSNIERTNTVAIIGHRMRQPHLVFQCAELCHLRLRAVRDGFDPIRASIINSIILLSWFHTTILEQSLITDAYSWAIEGFAWALSKCLDALGLLPVGSHRRCEDGCSSRSSAFGLEIIRVSCSAESH